jgi:hypothetical protein
VSAAAHIKITHTELLTVVWAIFLLFLQSILGDQIALYVDSSPRQPGGLQVMITPMQGDSGGIDSNVTHW